MKISFWIVCCLFSTCVNAQAIRFSKLEVKQKEIIILLSDTTFIDTLILNDQSQLRFMFPDNVLVVKKAFVGAGCILNASGQSGAMRDKFGAMGDNGLPGKNLTVVIYIIKLGDITVSTRGGDGGNGIGRGSGGNGGNGGAISFFYNTDFPIRFNSQGKQVVNFDYTFGVGGKRGESGMSVANAPMIQPTIQQSSTPRDPKNPFTAVEANRGNTKSIPASPGLPGSNGTVGTLEFARMELKF
ncbi:MAG TPA: hypothetical protein VIT44_13115 [Cyclobacteriaceae bacterium]